MKLIILHDGNYYCAECGLTCTPTLRFGKSLVSISHDIDGRDNPACSQWGKSVDVSLETFTVELS